MEPDPTVVAVLGPPPEGMDLTENQQNADNVAAILCAAIATIALGLRLYSRTFQRFDMLADDWLMIIALIFVYGTAAITILGGTHGAGKHIWVVPMTDVSMIFKLLYSYTYVYAGSVSFTKLSILLFYRRIFQRGTQWFHIRLAIASFLCIAYPITIWLVMAFVCKPVSQFWTQFLGTEGKCIDINTAFMVLTVVNMVNDIVVLMVPIPEILQLQMSSQKKMAVCGVMLLGGFVCVASIVRIWAFAEFIKAVDLTWSLAHVFLWSSIEPAVGIVSACLPSLRPLYRRAKGKLPSSGNTGNAGSNTTWANAKGSRGPNSYVRFGGDNESRAAADDEVALTSITRGPTGSDETIPKNSIMVRSDIVHQFDNAK
ncbi:hypothetical protein F4818DRAFT_122196 [Hypoxylon cercidicola]|nr:hypothetical protein F4818DRAFT_122196 [Hypoxylon cercidicola]